MQEAGVLSARPVSEGAVIELRTDRATEVVVWVRKAGTSEWQEGVRSPSYSPSHALYVDGLEAVCCPHVRKHPADDQSANFLTLKIGKHGQRHEQDQKRAIFRVCNSFVSII